MYMTHRGMRRDTRACANGHVKRGSSYTALRKREATESLNLNSKPYNGLLQALSNRINRLAIDRINRLAIEQ
jgi:hypothetical protein